MTIISEPTITHPAWCAPDHCEQETNRGVLVAVGHRTAPATWASGEPGTERIEAKTYLVAFDDYAGEPDEPPMVYATLGGYGVVSPDQLEALARWLTERAAEYRAAIDGESGEGARTVVDEDLGLAVSSEAGDQGGLVHMWADYWPERDVRDWQFVPAEARRLASALLAHAARAEAGA